MITAAQIVPYRTSSHDNNRTECLKTQFARLRQERQPLYLASAEFDKILHWKLRGQYGRQQEGRKANTEDVIRTVTSAAFSVTHPDEEYGIELREGILCALRGVTEKAAQIVPYRTSSHDNNRTECLKTQFARLRQERQPLYLASAEFDKILHWKLRGQYGRQQEGRKANTEDVIRTVTSAAFSVTHPDEEYGIELRVGILCALRGVGVPVASAVLALVFPEKYAVIDFRGWRQIFEEEKTTFSIPDYKKYLREVRRLADELVWSVQEVDLAIWGYDQVKPKPTRKT